MAVFIPPKIHAKANGIRNFDECQSIFWQILRVIGNSIASAPILLIKDDKIAAISSKEIRNWISVNSLPPINFPTRPAILSYLNPD